MAQHEPVARIEALCWRMGRKVPNADKMHCNKMMTPQAPDLLILKIAGRFAITYHLVPSDRVEAVAVYGRDGQIIGGIERLMLEKKAGTVAYAGRVESEL